ncbi:MAG: hypothetical protein ACETWG_05015 [Candidatus Neomarinimicrobiota bacterium]
MQGRPASGEPPQGHLVNAGTQTTLSRKGIFKRFPWLKERHLPMVISTDIDGLLSAAFLHHCLEWHVEGYYDCTTLWLSPDGVEHRDRLLWIDLDVCRPECRCLGHHILTVSEGIPPGLAHSCNPNLLAGIGADNFSAKYPYSTLLFLLWLHEQKPRRDLIARLLLLQADSAWINYQNYHENCQSWLERLPDYEWPWLFQNVDSERFDRLMSDQLYPKLAKLGAVPTAASTGSKYLGLKGRQLFFNPDWDEDIIIGVYGLAGTYLKWSPPHLPRITRRREGQRVRAALDSVGKSDFPGELIKEGVFSYAITGVNTLNFTRLDW